jgi:peroxiredoxin
VQVNGYEQKSVQTDANGRFRVDGVPPGKFYVSVRGGDENGGFELTAGKDNPPSHTNSMAALRRDQAAGKVGRPDHTGMPAGEFQVVGWLNTKPISMASLLGKFVLVDFWGCCADNLEQTQSMVKSFGDRGIVAIAMRVTDSDVTAQTLAAHAAAEHLTIPIAEDQNDKTAQALGSGGFESYVLIDRTGKIVSSGFDFYGAMAVLSRMLAAERLAAKQ